MRYALALALTASTTLLAGCDVGELESAAPGQSRPPVALAKDVTAVSTAELVGSWSCRELDPYPGQPAVTTTIGLAADGSMSSEALLPVAATSSGTSAMLVRTTGKWQVEGDRLVTTDTRVDVVAADGGGAFPPVVQGVAAAFADRAGDGSAEIFRITASELVMRDQAPDAPAVACARQA